MRLWKAISNQTGAVIVDDNENFWNTIKTFELLFPKYLPKGRRVGVITPGGGSSVNTTDLLASRNLSIPELTSQSQERISEILPKENVNIKNPVDLGALGFVVEIFIKCIEVVIRDPNVDIIVIPLWPHFLYNYVFKRMIKVQELTSKPIAFVLPSISDSLDIAQRFNTTKKTLHKEKIIYYFSLSEAAKSLSLLCDYSDFLKRIDS